MKPVVDAVEKKYAHALLVIRLNIQDSVGRKMAAEHGLEFSPTFIFFDAGGKEMWRTTGHLDVGMILDSLE